MPVFEYTALTDRGKETKGIIDAESVRGARTKIKAQGLFPVNVTEAATGKAAKPRFDDVRTLFTRERVSLHELTNMTHQLSILIHGGLPLVSALQALSEQQSSKTLQRIIITVRERVEQGESLAAALKHYPHIFPELYTNMVSAGEASGTLDAVLTDLGEYLATQEELKQKVFSALLYPVIMLIICSLVITVLMVVVVPKIVEMFQKQGATLPIPTQIVIGISHAIIHYWPVIIILLAAFFIGIPKYRATTVGRQGYDRLLLNLPLFSSLYQKVYTARVMRTLGTLLTNGVGLLQALDIVKPLAGNVHVAAAIKDTQEGVREGRSLARELTKSGLFPLMVSHMVAVGEQSGEIEKMLDRVGRTYENEVRTALGRLSTLLEPLLLVLVGGIVFVIIISVLMPMTDLISAVQKS